MGMYINPGIQSFRNKLKGDFVDKTGLIVEYNHLLDKGKSLCCFSRPRRFGKSTALSMMNAYYQCGIKTGDLFKNYEISSDVSFNEHLNQYNIIIFDLAVLKSDAKGIKNIIPYLEKKVRDEASAIIGRKINEEESFLSTLNAVVDSTGYQFIALIDEYDFLFREEPIDSSVREEYVDWLRAVFKNEANTFNVFAGVYMTGILPIIQVKGHSALSDFDNYTFIEPQQFAKYVGFTEDEVRDLCSHNKANHKLSFDEMKQWYEGYLVSGTDGVYNPYSVMQVVNSGIYNNYWVNTSSFETLSDLIKLDADGTYNDIDLMRNKEKVSVNISGFQNDVHFINNRDNLLTALIYLGYLTYDKSSGLAYIPNKELYAEFDRVMEEDNDLATISLIFQQSKALLQSIIEGKADDVAKRICLIHDSDYSPLTYNEEECLRSCIRTAMFANRRYFAKAEELPTGHGYADIVYLPLPKSPYPPILFELKWNKTTTTAISQVKSRNYPASLANYYGRIILVAVNYTDDSSKKHTCVIENWSKD